ncbi:nuclear transport factor 2 family protein [Amycolatopsis sp. Poz14]|uniref:nuclear transport factor 2 family protein n=1 Tax=Amycolatopsis sp. Poz14 TaxID=1447705 RepID=UPI001EE8525E|nr:nuclear transport factor 2 family protein [Amycolatopsis sp. Poz14]MCG3753944.1 nuclear transport factor 2 family protein [Amycolatopsis sp. Poz14]
MGNLTEAERHRLREELDRAAIRAALLRYCRGVDRADETVLASAYHPDAIDAHGPFHGNAHEFAHWCVAEIPRQRLGLQHITGNALIEFDGENAEVARVESYYISTSRLRSEPGVLTLMAGRYLDRFERRDTGWRIGHRTVTKDWAISDRLAPDRAVSWTGFPQGSFGRTDPLCSAETWISPSRKDGPAMPARTGEFDDTELTALRTALARAEITDAVYRFCRGVDRGDEPIIRSVFHPDAAVAIGDFARTGPGFAAELAGNLPSEWLGAHHFVGNVFIEFDGDTARCESYFTVGFRLRSDPAIAGQIGGRFLDRFERRGDGPWLIARRTAVKDWTLSDRIEAGVSPSVRGYPEGRMDRQDLLFAPSTWASAAER